MLYSEVVNVKNFCVVINVKINVINVID